MKYRNIIASAAMAALATAVPAFAVDLEYDSADGTHIRLEHVQPTLIVAQGVTPRDLPAGETHVDTLKRLICHSSAGCLVTAKIWISFLGAYAPKVSAYVDNVAMEPANVITDSEVLTAQQSVLVSTGIHTAQTKVTKGKKQGQMTGWNIEYAKYELPVVR